MIKSTYKRVKWRLFLHSIMRFKYFSTRSINGYSQSYTPVDMEKYESDIKLRIINITPNIPLTHGIWGNLELSIKDIQRQIQYKDFSQGHHKSLLSSQEFKNVEQMLYYINEIWGRELSEDLVSKTLDLIIWNIVNNFVNTDEVLSNPLFKNFLEELGGYIPAITESQTISKICKVLDLLVINEHSIWLLLENKVKQKCLQIEKGDLVNIISHFSNQLEGSRSLYMVFEHLYASKVFRENNLDELISLGTSFYNVREGSISFFKSYYSQLFHSLNGEKENIPITQLICILHIFAPISTYPEFRDLFSLSEEILLNRYGSLGLEEISCILGCLGGSTAKICSNYFMAALEFRVSKCLSKITDHKMLRQITSGLIISGRGSLSIFILLEPKIIEYISYFDIIDICGIFYAYHKVDSGSKTLDWQVAKYLLQKLDTQSTPTKSEVCKLVMTFTKYPVNSKLNNLIERHLLGILNRFEDSKELERIYKQLEITGHCNIETANIIKNRLYYLEEERQSKLFRI